MGESNMKRTGIQSLAAGMACLAAFAVFTLLLRVVDVQPVGQNGTDIGFASLNLWFHRMTGVSMTLYVITDWLGLVPLLVCMQFGAMGLMQWIRRKRIACVDRELLILGGYYVCVILCYLLFERIPINYRPIPIDGYMEVSYPSSTTLLVLCVMPTPVFYGNRSRKSSFVRRGIGIAAGIFTVLTVTARLISGVHWLTDIVGAILLGTGLFLLYRAAVLLCCRGRTDKN